MGRRPKSTSVTGVQRARALAALAGGSSQREAAAATGLSKTTVHEILHRDPEAVERIRQAARVAATEDASLAMTYGLAEIRRRLATTDVIEAESLRDLVHATAMVRDTWAALSEVSGGSESDQIDNLLLSRDKMESRLEELLAARARRIRAGGPSSPESPPLAATDQAHDVTIGDGDAPSMPGDQAPKRTTT